MTRILDALLLLDRCGRIIAANNGATALLKFSQEELLRMKLGDLIPAQMGETTAMSALEHDFSAVVAGQLGEATGYVYALCKSKGSVPLRWELSSLLIAESAPVFSLALLQATHVSDEVPIVAGYRDVFEHAVEGLYRSSIEGQYLQVNPALARMYGYPTPAELIARFGDLNTQLYVQPNRRGEFVHLMNRDGFIADFESEVRRLDGEIIWITEFGRVVRSDDGRPWYFEGSVINITERKRAEAALKESKEKYRHLVEMTNVVPWEADLDTRVFTYVGPQAVDFLGYSVEEWLQPGFWQRIVHVEDRVWATIVRDEAIEKRQRFECEYRLLRADGHYVWAREIISVLPGRGRKPRLGGFMLDVTYRRESEASLVESQDFIEQIAEASPTISYLYDPARQQSTYVNGRVPHILGYTKKALSEMHPFFILSLAHPDELSAHNEYFECWQDVSSAKVLEREFRLRNASGGWVWLRSRECIFKREPSSGVVRVIGTIEDITMQRATLDELAENERVFRRLVETTGAVPFDFDLATERFTYVGPQAERMFGYPLRRWYSADFWSSFIIPTKDDSGNLFNRRTPVLCDFQIEFPVLAASGQCMWVRQIVHWAEDEDDRKRVRGFLFDVTEAHQAEEERERSRIQLRELAARGQEIREEERVSIAREIHDALGQALTLLNIDLAWLQTRIGKTVAADVREALVEKIRAMEQGVQATLEIVRRILCALRPPLLDELGLKDAIEWQMQDFSKRVGIRHEVDATPVTLLATSATTAVFRIFQEILTNAARHARASRIKVALHETPTEVFMRVEDNGIGISRDRLAQTKSFGLLGMRERAWSVGGKLEIGGGPGQGTIITLRIPIGHNMQNVA